MASIRQTDRLLSVAELMLRHGPDLSMHIGAEFPGQHRPILIQIRCPAEALEKIIRKQSMLSLLVGMSLLQGIIPDHPHKPLFLLLRFACLPYRRDRTTGFRPRSRFQRHIQEQDRPGNLRSG